MPYLTRGELIERFGESEIVRLERNIAKTDGANPPTSEQAISDAEEMVNGYVAVQYPLPLPVTTEPVKRAVAVIARYFLYKDKPTEIVRMDYEDVISWLKQIAAGKAVLIFPVDDDQPERLVGTGIFVV
ncbi:gp436 family protein [Acinetobacter beijerinckii]|uniref:gp436 family protein n=1 Tax=Acinetobacter beijerinckii TaxID=262668 RepID=UPI003AF8FA17